MRIHKGTFKIREHHEGERKWGYYDGSYGNDYPFYVHRKENEKTWTLSHMSTGYMIKKSLSLKDARRLVLALKEWPLFLMPTIPLMTAHPDWAEVRKKVLALKHRYGVD